MYSIILSLSGGKDSAAMALYLQEQGLQFEAVFADTGWEHPATYEYLHTELESRFGPIRWLRGEKPMVDLIRSKATFPSRVRRFCTEKLKVIPIRDYLASVIEREGTVINAVGIRRSESLARSQLPEVERWGADGRGDMDCWIWRPIVDWSEEDVIAIHKRHHLPPNPLYLQGATRVGCWPCIHARKAEIALVAHLSPERIDLIRELEEELTAKAQERSAVRATKPWPEGLDEEGEERERQLRDPMHERQARAFFLSSRPTGVPPIDEVVAWANTKRGGKEVDKDLLDNVASDGCMRWGMCEVEVEVEGVGDTITPR